MKHVSQTLMIVVALSALIAGGCARNESIKKDDASTTAMSTKADKNATSQTTPQQQPAVSAQPAKPAKSATDAAQDEALRQAEMNKKSSLAQRLETIYFDYDKSDLMPESRNALAKNAELLKKKSGTVVTIEGHCDERGSAEYNLALGERRAKSTLQYLLTLGVPAERLSTVSYGKEKPAVDGHDEAAWAKNRRAEFK